MEWTSIVPFLLGSSRRKLCPACGSGSNNIMVISGCEQTRFEKKIHCRTNRTDLSFACLQRLTTLNRQGRGTRSLLGIEIQHDPADPDRSDMDIRFFSPEIEFAADKDLAVFRWRKSHDRRTCQHVWYTIYFYFLLLSVRTMSLNIGLDLSERERKKAINARRWFEWKCKHKVNVKCGRTKCIFTSSI